MLLGPETQNKKIGGGGGRKKFLFSKNVPGVLNRKKNGRGYFGAEEKN